MGPKTLKLAIMKIGVTPSNYDPKYNNCIERIDRKEIGLPESFDPMIATVYEEPYDPGKYKIVGITIDEAKKLREGKILLEEAQIELVFDDKYKENNDEFFAELPNAIGEVG